MKLLNGVLIFCVTVLGTSGCGQPQVIGRAAQDVEMTEALELGTSPIETRAVEQFEALEDFTSGSLSIVPPQFPAGGDCTVWLPADLNGLITQSGCRIYGWLPQYTEEASYEVLWRLKIPGQAERWSVGTIHHLPAL